MSIALSIAIHQALISGLPLGDQNILAPYGGCWVPHEKILSLPKEWVLVPDDDYDPHDVPDWVNGNNPVDIVYDDGVVWCSDGETVSCFRIRKEGGPATAPATGEEDE